MRSGDFRASDNKTDKPITLPPAHAHGVTIYVLCITMNSSIAYIIAKCYNPGPMVTADLIIEGYEDPALEGENITFSCNDGLTLIGSNSSTCMENGRWEPDPREVNCTGVSLSKYYE